MSESVLQSPVLLLGFDMGAVFVSMPMCDAGVARCGGGQADMPRSASDLGRGTDGDGTAGAPPGRH